MLCYHFLILKLCFIQYFSISLILFEFHTSGINMSKNIWEPSLKDSWYIVRNANLAVEYVENRYLIMTEDLPRRHLLFQCHLRKQQNNVQDLFKLTMKTSEQCYCIDWSGVIILKFNRFHTLFWCFHRWFWISECRLGYYRSYANWI